MTGCFSLSLRRKIIFGRRPLGNEAMTCDFRRIYFMITILVHVEASEYYQDVNADYLEDIDDYLNSKNSTDVTTNYEKTKSSTDQAQVNDSFETNIFEHQYSTNDEIIRSLTSTKNPHHFTKSEKKSTSSPTWISLACVAALIVIALIAVGVVIFVNHKRDTKQKEKKRSKGSSDFNKDISKNSTTSGTIPSSWSNYERSNISLPTFNEEAFVITPQESLYGIGVCNESEPIKATKEPKNVPNKGNISLPSLLPKSVVEKVPPKKFSLVKNASPKSTCPKEKTIAKKVCLVEKRITLQTQFA